MLHVRRAGGRHEMTLNRPAKRNALTPELDSAIAAALRAFDADNDARVAVLIGADPAFCAAVLKLAGHGGHPRADQALQSAGRCRCETHGQ